MEFIVLNLETINLVGGCVYLENPQWSNNFWKDINISYQIIHLALFLKNNKI